MSSSNDYAVKPFDPEIQGPEDVKALPEERLPELAEAIREVLTPALEDSRSAMKWATASASWSKTRHIDTAFHKLRE